MNNWMNYRVLSLCYFFVPRKICIERSDIYNYFSTVPMIDKTNVRKDFLKKLWKTQMDLGENYPNPFLEWVLPGSF